MNDTHNPAQVALDYLFALQLRDVADATCDDRWLDAACDLDDLNRDTAIDILQTVAI